jgi:hypothetical protein
VGIESKAVVVKNGTATATATGVGAILLFRSGLAN